jgi:membrane protein required for colicin V production
LNWVDAAILLTLAWFTYTAFHAGFIREAITFIGAVLAVMLAGLFYLQFAEDVEVAVSDPQTARIIAFAIIFGATILASQLLAMFLKSAASLLLLGFLDSLGGAAIGIIKGIILVEIGLIVAITFPALGLERAVRESMLAPVFLDFLPFLRPLLPSEFRDAIDAF